MNELTTHHHDDDERGGVGVGVPFGAFLAMVIIGAITATMSIVGSLTVITQCLQRLQWFKRRHVETTNRRIQQHEQHDNEQGGTQESPRRSSGLARRQSSSSSSSSSTSDTYYIIMLFLSLGDLVTSIHLLFVWYLPPAELRDANHVYFAAGSAATCSMSGFMLVVGTIYAAHWNCLLSVHFLLSIRYKTSIRAGNHLTTTRAAKVVVVPIMILATALPIVAGAYLAHQEVFHFSMLSFTCNISRTPLGCTSQDNCSHGAQSLLFGFIAATWIAVVAVVGCLCTCLVYLTIRNRLHANVRHTFSNNLTTTQAKLLRQSGWQAVMYYLAYFNTAFWPFSILLIRSVQVEEEWIYNQSRPTWGVVMLVISSIFFPLQGFLNASIFIRPQVLRWRELNPNASAWWIVRRASSSEEPRRVDVAAQEVVLNPVLEGNNNLDEEQVPTCEGPSPATQDASKRHKERSTGTLMAF